MKMTVEASHEKRRGCGYRYAGKSGLGVYLESRKGPTGVLPAFVVLKPAVEVEGPSFRGYRYLTTELWDRWTEDSPAIGVELRDELRTVVSNAFVEQLPEVGDHAWSAYTWFQSAMTENTPKARVLLEMALLEQGLADPSKLDGAKELIKEGGW